MNMNDLNYSTVTLDFRPQPEMVPIPVTPVYQSPGIQNGIQYLQPQRAKNENTETIPQSTCPPFLYSNIVTQCLELKYKNAKFYEPVVNGHVVKVVTCTYDKFFKREDDIRITFQFMDNSQKEIVIPKSNLVGKKIEDAFRQQAHIILAYSVNKDLFHMALANYISGLAKDAPIEHYIYHSGWSDSSGKLRYRTIAERETTPVQSAYSQKHLLSKCSEPLNILRSYIGLSSVFKNKNKFLFLALLLHNSICCSLLNYAYAAFPIPITISCPETISHTLIPYFLQQFNRNKLGVHASLSQKAAELEKVLYDAKDETVIIADDDESFRQFDALVAKIKGNLPMTKNVTDSDVEFRCQSNIVFLSSRAPFHYSSDDLFFFDIEEEDINLMACQQVLSDEFGVSNHIRCFIDFCERQSGNLIQLIKELVSIHLEKVEELSIFERKMYASLMATADIMERYAQSLGLSFQQIFGRDEESFASIVLSFIENSSSTCDSQELMAMFKETILVMSARNEFNIINRRSGETLNTPYDPHRINVYIDTDWVYFTRPILMKYICPNFIYGVPLIRIQRALVEQNSLKKHSGRGLDTKATFKLPDGSSKILHAVTISREAFKHYGTLDPFSGF